MEKIYYISADDKVTTTLEKKYLLQLGCALRQKRGWQAAFISACLFHAGTLILVLQSDPRHYWWNWLMDGLTLLAALYSAYLLFSAWDAKRFRPDASKGE